MTLIKSISGIRGTIGGAAGDNLTPLDLVKFTSAYAEWLKGEHPGRRLKVVIGRDARLSGEMAAAIVEGTLCGCGVDVINIGLATTPTVELAVTGKQADGGIILTASHNPKQWNALKLLNSHGEFLNDAEGKKVLQAYRPIRRSTGSVASSNAAATTTNTSAVRWHSSWLTSMRYAKPNSRW